VSPQPHRPFLHVPFPPPEILTALPNHELADPAIDARTILVGLQTDNAAGNLARYSKMNADWRSAATCVYQTGNSDRARPGAFPIGIETPSSSRLARSFRRPPVRSMVEPSPAAR